MPNYNNNFNPYNPYNPYTMPQTKINQYSFVNGIEGAKAYQVMPNQKMMLLDSDRPIVYMKTSDEYGKSSLRYFKLVEIKEDDLKVQQPENSSQYALKADLEALKQELINLSNKLEKPLKSENKEE